MSLNLPNLLTLLRLGLVPLFVIYLLEGAPGPALAVFAVAGLTDALDGLLARALRQQSVLGAYLDPLADKLMLMSAYVLLAIPATRPGIPMPLWVTVVVLARDVLILAVALVFFLALRVTDLRPTLLSKVNTVLQILGVLLVLASGLAPGWAAPARVCVYVVGGFTVLSGLDYLYRANRMLSERQRSGEVAGGLEGPPGG